MKKQNQVEIPVTVVTKKVATGACPCGCCGYCCK